MGFPDQVRTVIAPLNSRAYARRAFVASSAEFSVGVGQTFRAMISNPVGSKRIIVLDHFDAVTVVGSIIRGSLVINPTANLPTTSLVVTNLRPGLNPTTSDAVGLVKADLGAAMSGGFTTGASVALNGESYDAPFHLDEGVSFGLNVPALLGAIGIFSIYWWEMET